MVGQTMLSSSLSTYGVHESAMDIMEEIIFDYFFKFYFIFKFYIIVLVLPNIKMNLPQVYMCSPS